MSVDWITVIAQILNFLVLIWLLKRFLYRPILDGIDAREAEIANRMAVAAKAGEKAEAAEALYQDQLITLNDNAAAMTDSARQSAQSAHDALLADAHAELEQEKKDWKAQKEQERVAYTVELHNAGIGGLLSLTRKALNDLADETLEERMVAHITSRLVPTSQELRKAAGDCTEAIATTHAPLPKTARERLKRDFHKVIPDLPLRFETSEAQSPGLVIRMGGAQVSWTLDTYFDGLDAIMQEKLATGTIELGQRDDD